MKRSAIAPFTLLCMLGLLTIGFTTACQTDDPSEGDALGDGDGDGDGNGDGDGDGDGETGDTADDSASCELWEGDATYPGDCSCASPGEECVQGCLIPDGVQTCNDVCAELGETCVENGCDGGTYTGGYTCPAPSEFSPAVPHACDVPVPMEDAVEDTPFGVSCCCTRD